METPIASATLNVYKVGSRASTKGSADYFTGTVRIDPLVSPIEPSRVGAGMVTFEPGARTAWHTHPAGQTLIVTTGSGFVQEWGKEAQKISAGDVVQIPAEMKHWHGASATTAMTHIAVQETVNGTPVTWMEHVTDEQYQQV